MQLKKVKEQQKRMELHPKEDKLTEDMPELTSIKRGEKTVFIEYRWKHGLDENIRIEFIEYSDNNLQYLDRIHNPDGIDRTAFTKKNTTYILRKTTEEFARNILKNAGFLKTIDKVVAYLKTLKGNHYLVSAVNEPVWSTDNYTYQGRILPLDMDNLGKPERYKLMELVIEEVVRLHKNNIIIKNFELSNILVNSKRVSMSDIRGLKNIKDKEEIVDNFIEIIGCLKKYGMDDGELFYLVSLYTNHLEEECLQWYVEETDREADIIEIATEIETRCL